MAANTPDPRRPFLSTRFNTNRYPGFYSRTLSNTGNVEDEVKPAPVSPLRGVGIGSANESDGPSPENVGPGSKQYSDMTDQEFDEDTKNREFAQSVFGLGVPTDIEGWGKKGLGLMASLSPVGLIGPAAKALNYFTQEEFDKALSDAGVKDAANRSGGPAPSDPTAEGAIGSHPDDYGYSSTPGGAGYDPNRSPETSSSYSDNEGDTSQQTAQAEGAIGSHPDDYSGNESDGQGSGSNSGGTSGGGGSPGDGWRRGGPIPNKGSPELEPVRITAHEGEHVMNPEAVAFWGDDVLAAMQAVGEGTATDEQIQLLLNEVRRGAAQAAPQARPNPMQAMGSPLRNAGAGMMGG